MPMIVITIAILIGVSTPQYKEYAKHSNGNAAYTVGYVAPCLSLIHISEPTRRS